MTRKIASVAAFAVFLAAVFAAAGTLRWTAGWIYFASYVLAVMGLVAWLKKHSPDLLAERLAPAKNAKRWDRVVVFIYTILLVIMFPVVAADARRFGWSRIPTVLRGVSVAVIVLAAALGFWAFRENAFLSSYVRIQSDRGHKVCSTGPYRFIRHPMYLAVILLVLATPPVLGSFYGLIPAALVAALFVLRTALEDKTLRAELPGYEEYAERTRWKLVPGLW